LAGFLPALRLHFDAISDFGMRKSALVELCGFNFACLEEASVNVQFFRALIEPIEKVIGKRTFAAKHRAHPAQSSI
jgi:hypothetical protein